MSPARLLFIAVLVFQVATCGQKGPLYLPSPDAQAVEYSGTTLACMTAEHIALPRQGLSAAASLPGSLAPGEALDS